MKVITKCVIDMTTLQEKYEESYDYDGPVALCGGGGSQGAIEYPQYMETQHTAWLTEFDTILSSYVDAGSSPYDGTTAYDPATAITGIQTALTEYDGLVDAVDKINDWESIINKAKAKADELFPYLESIEEAVDAFDQRSAKRYKRSHAQLAGAMAEIGAINGTAFAIGMAMLEEDRMQEVNEFETNLLLQQDQQRVNFWIQATQAMLQIYFTKLQHTQGVMDASLRSNQVKINAERMQEDRDIELDVLDAKWEIDLFSHAGNLMGSIAGTAIPSQQGNAVGDFLGIAGMLLTLL